MTNIGIPTIAPITVMVRIIPASMSAKPKMTATNLPVSITIEATKFHNQTKGLNSQ
jgi:hypothetical protein